MENKVTHYSNFETFMQASINAASQKLESRYGMSIIDVMNGSSKETRNKFAKIIKDIVNGSHNYKNRFNRISEMNHDMTPLVNECASSIMLQVVLSDII